LVADLTALQTDLAQLRERYLQTSGSNIAAMEQLAVQLSRRPTAPEVISALRLELHRFRGTSGTYGFTEASQLAEQLEERAVLWAKDPQLEPEQRSRLVMQSLRDIRHTLAQPDGAATQDSATLPNEIPFSPAIGFAGSTVLVLDDDPLMLQLATAILTSEMVRVVRTSEPAQLWELLDTVHPALLLLDINMGDVNGISLARDIRAKSEFRELPIIIMSADTTPDVRQAAYDAGANGFVGKPLVPSELRGRITESLTRVRVQRIDQGLHPATGLPYATRSTRDADAACAAIRARGHTCTVVLIHPILLGSTPEAMTAWFEEIGRIAREFGRAPATIGHADELSLLVVLDGSANDVTHLCETIHAGHPPSAPPWRAAIVTSEETQIDDLSALRRTAVDVLAETPAEQSAVIGWRLRETDQAPDVIIIEDDDALADMLEYALRAAGISYRIFSDGLAAIEALLTMRVHGTRPVVLLDINLPGVDGHSLNERLRAERPGVFAVVFVTVRSSEVDQVRALRAGAVDYLAKPINLRILMAKLPTWLGRSPQAT
jgi:DNA-binding response OmpR family regulator/HPt (histidine-containing phosphotransfer) domain-containing protein